MVFSSECKIEFAWKSCSLCIYQHFSLYLITHQWHFGDLWELPCENMTLITFPRSYGVCGSKQVKLVKRREHEGSKVSHMHHN